MAPLRAPVAGQTFEGSSAVLVVEVPVNVVSRDGEPLRGLSAADFELYEEGQRVAITDFEVIDLEVVEPTTAAPPQRRELPSAARRHFLLLFDLSFSRPTAILRARQAARESVLSSLHPDDLVAVATYSLEEGPRLVVTFTPDRAQVAQAIDTLGLRRNGPASANLDPLRFLVAPPASAILGAGTGDSGLAEARQVEDAETAVLEHLTIMNQQVDRSQRAFDSSRITSFSRAFGDMARMLGAVPGRKQVILFSEGFDSRLLLGRPPDGTDEEQNRDRLNLNSGRTWLVDTDQMYGNTALMSELERMLEQFRRADCVIQAIDAGGLRASGERQQRARAFGEDSLFVIANETGGELFRGGNDLGKQLAGVLRRSEVTYLLSFHPSQTEADGAFRRLRVKLKEGQRGVSVSHREGYFRPRPFADLHPLERSLLASGAIASPRAAGDFTVNVLLAPFRATESLAYVPVIVEISGRELLAGHDGDQLPLEIYAYVTDDRGEMRDFFSQVISLDLRRNRAELAQSGLKYYGHLELPPGRFRVRLLVRSAADGRRAVAAVPLEIPDYTAARPSLLPPFFVEPPGRWLLVRGRAAAGETDRVVYPFTVNGEPYVPAARPLLAAGGADSDLCIVGYNLPVGDLSLEGRVRTASGEPVTGGRLLLVERTATGLAGVDKLLATFAPVGLRPGDYVLEVELGATSHDQVGPTSIPFTVLN
jgi:VWFA-related protein